MTYEEKYKKLVYIINEAKNIYTNLDTPTTTRDIYHAEAIETVIYAFLEKIEEIEQM